MAPDLRSDLLSVEEEVALGAGAPRDERRQVRAGDVPGIDRHPRKRHVCRRLSHARAIVPLVGAEDVELFVDEDLLSGGGGVLVDHGEGEPGRRDLGVGVRPRKERRVVSARLVEVGHVVGEQTVVMVGIRPEVRDIVVPVHVGDPDAVEVDRDVVGCRVGVVPAVGHVEPGIVNRRAFREREVSRRPGHGVVRPALAAETAGHVLTVAEGVDDVAAKVVGPHRGDVAAALPVHLALIAVVKDGFSGEADLYVVGLVGLGDEVIGVDDGGVSHGAALKVADRWVDDGGDGDLGSARKRFDGRGVDRDGTFGDVAHVQGDHDIGRGISPGVLDAPDLNRVWFPCKDRDAGIRVHDAGDVEVDLGGRSHRHLCRPGHAPCSSGDGCRPCRKGGEVPGRVHCAGGLVAARPVERDAGHLVVVLVLCDGGELLGGVDRQVRRRGRDLDGRQDRGRTAKFRYEGVVTAAATRLERTVRHRDGRCGISGDVEISGIIHRNALPVVIATASPEVGCVVERGTI
ncbi:hypothetical protein DSECCO2_446330 [anaerobic digester metagenome]